MSAGADGASAPGPTPGGFTFIAPTVDACEGDACLIPGAPTGGTDLPSLLGGDVRDGRPER